MGYELENALKNEKIRLQKESKKAEANRKNMADPVLSNLGATEDTGRGGNG